MDLPVQAVWQGAVNGLALGWIYVLMALGLTLIFGIMHIMQFAHGEIYMIGAYVVYYLTASFKLPLFIATVLSMIVMATIGLILERFLFRPLKEDWLSAVVATTGLTLILQSGAVVVFGLYERSIPLLAHGPFTTLYGHLSSIAVKCNTWVDAGTIIGGVGSTTGSECLSVA